MVESTGWPPPFPADVTGSLGGVDFVGTSSGWTVGSRLGHGPANAAGGYVLATSDGGRTWAPQPVPSDVARLNRIAFADARHGWAVGVAADGRPALIATNDGGRTWTHQAETARELWTLAIVDESTVFAGGGYGLWSTQDGGATWSEQRFGLPALDAVAFADRSHGWVTHSMFSVVCRTDDGGRTWTTSDIRPGRTPAIGCP